MSEKLIYLKNLKNTAWESFEYIFYEDLNPLFKERNIEIKPFIHLGDRCRIGNNCKIGFNVQIGGGVVLNDNCTVGSGAIIDIFTYIGENCYIGGHTFIGANSLVLSDITIDDGCKLNDRCVVTKNVNHSWIFIRGTNLTIAQVSNNYDLYINDLNKSLDQWEKEIDAVAKSANEKELIPEYKIYIEAIKKIRDLKQGEEEITVDFCKVCNLCVDCCECNRRR